ncbi:MAG: hypothetical protein KKA42_00090 [candidate division Zixibacteria bacterium]|nr:hypothetical protein [candidate division Zixibacteria bacterium]
MFRTTVLVVLAVVVVGLAAAYFMRNVLVAQGIEAGSSYALGVETDLASAEVEIMGGSLELNDFEVKNPEGFEADNIMSLRRGKLMVDAGSILDEEVFVDSFIIEGVTLNLEQIDTRGNYKVLLDNIKRLGLETSEDESTRKLRIGYVAIRDIQVSGSLTALGKKYDKSYAVDGFTLKNVGGDAGATIPQVTTELVKALLTRSVAAGGGVMPDGFGKTVLDLKDQGLKQLESEAKDKLKDLSKSLTGGGE